MALLLGASILWPPWSGYDEGAHVDMAYAYSANPFHVYAPATLKVSDAFVAINKIEPAFSLQPPLDAHAVLPRSARPSFQQLGGNHRSYGNGLNQMVQHPPLYYEGAALVLRIPGVSTLAWDLQVWLMRLVSVLVMSPVPVLCWLAARRLLLASSGDEPIDGTSDDNPPDADWASKAALLGAVLPLTIPNMVRDGSAVTNDSLLVLTTSVALWGVVQIVTGDRTVRTAGVVSVATAAALLTKGFSLVLPLIVVAAYLLAPGRGAGRDRPWRPLGVALAGCVVGGLWWVRNLIEFGTVQPDGNSAAANVVLYGPERNDGVWTSFVPRFLTDFVSRLWGGIGLADVPSMGPVLTYGWFTVVGAAVLAAVWTRHPARRATLLLAAAPVLTLFIVAQGSWSAYFHWPDHTRGSQGRYVYQTVVVAAALAALGVMRVLQPAARRRLPLALLAGALVTNLAAWVLVMRSWYESGAGWVGMRRAADAILAWSPLPVGLTVALVVVVPLLAAGVAVAMTYASLRSPPLVVGDSVPRSPDRRELSAVDGTLA